MIRGIRGAITARSNSTRDIVDSTIRLLKEIVEVNKIKEGDIASVIFSATKDLNAEFPAKAARIMGWNDIPLFCAQEIAVPKSLKKCIRVLLHVNTGKTQKAVKHIYLEGAKALRKEFNS